MNYYGGKDLAASFRTVRKNTVQIAEEIPEDKYDFRATPDTQSIGQMLTHIALGPSFQSHIHVNGLTDMATINFPELFQKFSAEEAKPRTKAEIVEKLKADGEEFASYLENLTDAFLGEPVKMGPGSQPETKSRFDMLLSAKEHEMHHRGQLMLLQRMIGIVPHLTRNMQARMAQMQQPAQAQR